MNFNPTRISRPEYWLASTPVVFEKVGIPQTDVVFEVVESGRIAKVDHPRRILNPYRETIAKNLINLARPRPVSEVLEARDENI